MRVMVALTREQEIPGGSCGKRSKKGHPHHPLYLRKDSTPEPFDVENYLDTCFCCPTRQEESCFDRRTV